jgi:hypothetical protein
MGIPLYMKGRMVTMTVFKIMNDIWLQVVPLLLNQYHKGSSLEGKIIVLQTLTMFLAVCEEQHITPSSKDKYNLTSLHLQKNLYCNLRNSSSCL